MQSKLINRKMMKPLSIQNSVTSEYYAIMDIEMVQGVCHYFPTQKTFLFHSGAYNRYRLHMLVATKSELQTIFLKENLYLDCRYFHVCTICHWTPINRAKTILSSLT